MHKHIFITFVISIALISGCASNRQAQRQAQFKKQTKSNSDTFYDLNKTRLAQTTNFINSYASNKDFCALPLLISETGLILSTSPTLSRKGISAGLFIESIGDYPVSNRDEALQILHEKYKRSDSVILTMSSYLGINSEASVNCLDGDSVFRHLELAIDAHNKKKWGKCQQHAKNYESAIKIRTNASTMLHSACYQQTNLSKGKPVTRDHVSDNLNNHRLGFDALRYDILGDYNEIEQSVLNFGNWARSAGAADLAQLAINEHQRALSDRQNNIRQYEKRSRVKLSTNNATVSTNNARDIFELVSPTVYAVLTNTGGQGSGVAITENSIVTNCHVVEDADSILVKRGQIQFPATVIREETEKDICVLQTSLSSLQFASTGSSSNTQIGQSIYAVGAPQGLELTISEGLLSQKRAARLMMNVQSKQPILQISAAISPGSSGGGIFNTNGELIGISTFGLRDAQNLNFAVPIEWALE